MKVSPCMPHRALEHREFYVCDLCGVREGFGFAMLFGEHGAAACEPCISRFSAAFGRLSEQRKVASARCAALHVETLAAPGEQAAPRPQAD